MKNLVILISGTGTNMQAVINACKNKQINARVCAVISSNNTAKGLEKAQNEGIPVYAFCLDQFASREERDLKILQVAKSCNADFLVLAGYLGIVTDVLLSTFPQKIINIHPSLLPSYGGKGFFGLNVHKAVIKNGEKISGATVHFVDSGTDTGQIIAQKSLDVLPLDTPETLQKRILTQIEPFLLIDVLKKLC